jgi:transcriptional regulator with GAF, ATPase, and Fis domain
VIASVLDLREPRRIENSGAVSAPDDCLGWFERLLADLSATFMNTPSEQVDGVIRAAQQQVVDALDLDRTTLWLAEDGDLVRSHHWTSSGVLTRGWFPSEARISARELFPWSLERTSAGELVRFSSVDELPDVPDRENYRRFGTKSMVVVPLRVGGRTLGAVAFATVRAERPWAPGTLDRLQLIARAFAGLLARRQADKSLRAALNEVSQLKELQAENVCLRKEVRESTGTGLVIGEGPALRRVQEQVQQVAATDSTVLLLGETGSGKEQFATQIHELSARHGRTMVRVNCAAIPATLMESELFGREKGAYTGALARQIGRFEMADHSTIFLDEIGDLPPDVQVKLLRVLEEKQIERLGSPKPIRVDPRIIAATHRDLEQLIAAGTFREDLYYRLCVFPIRVPPLREHVEDIPRLVWRFVEEFSKAFGKRIDSIAKEEMAQLQQYPWPGNIRELRNVIERAMIVGTGPRLTFVLPTASTASTKRSAKLVDVERAHIRAVLESTGWRVRGVGGAADRLGLRPTTLETRLAKLGLKRPSPVS